MSSHLIKGNTDILDNLGLFSEKVSCIYERAIEEYHIYNDIEKPVCNPYYEGGFEHLLYLKCWIDTVQWHVEDEIRTININPAYALTLKRRIDALNQDRTNKVELIDDVLLRQFRDATKNPQARINSESPAWAIDRLSILSLKIYHMNVETRRTDAAAEHTERCHNKLKILNEQKQDLSRSINELLQDISEGNKCMKVYRQVKMYNDPSLNPALYKSSKL